MSFPIDTLGLLQKYQAERKFIIQKGHGNLVLYFVAQTFETFFGNNGKRKDKSTCASFCCEKWFFLYNMVFVLVFWCTSVLIWCMLSALINPEAFLAYAAMAGTLVTAVFAKYRQLKQLWHRNIDEIVNMFWAVAEEKINGVIKTLVEGLTLVDGKDAMNQVGHVIGAVAGEDAEAQFTQHAMMLGGTHLGKNIASAGFDVGMMLKLASGDFSAITAFAEENGLPQEIGHLLTELANGNGDGVVKAIGDLLKKNQNLSPIAPELAIALAELAFAPTRAKAQKFVRAVLQHGLPAMMKLWSTQVQPANAKLESLNSLIRELAYDDEAVDVCAILKTVLIETDPEKRRQVLENQLYRGDVDELDIGKRQEALEKILKLASDTSLRDVGISTAAALGLDGHPAVAKLGSLVDTKTRVAEQSKGMIDALLLDVVPTLLKGFVHLIAQNDYQEFVTSLRYVHNYLMDQKQLILSTFGSSFYDNLMLTRPIFHVLDLLSSKGQYQNIILEFIEDKSFLNFPKEVTAFLKMCVWLRVPTSKQDVLTGPKNEMQMKYLTSYTDRVKVVQAALRCLGIPKELHILGELLVAFVLDDFRSMTFADTGKRVSEACLLLMEHVHMDDELQKLVKQIMSNCFGYALVFLVTLNLGHNVDMFRTLQSRTGLDQEHTNEIFDLFVHRYLNPLEPPQSMTKWHILIAASATVGLGVEEAVGLTQICLGHTDTREAMSFIRELLRRQGIHQQGVDQLVKNLLAVSVAPNDQSVMHALQQLRVRERFLSILGLGYVPPRYFSEILLRKVGICDTEVLIKRLKVPFRYEDDPDIWDEWLHKAKECVRGKRGHQLGKWHHIVDKPVDNDGGYGNNRKFSNSRKKGINPVEEALKRRRQVGSNKKIAAITTSPGAIITSPNLVAPVVDVDVEKGLNATSASVSRPYDSRREKEMCWEKQLEWLNGTLDAPAIQFFVEYFNNQARREQDESWYSQQPTRAKGDRISRLGHEKKDYEETLAQRLLLQEQDTSTGILQPLHLTPEQCEILARIMSIKTLIRPHQKDSKNRRNIIIQDFADMLGIGSRELTTFMDMVRPSSTKQARNAVEVLGKEQFHEGVCLALSQTVYNVRRSTQMFDEIKAKLWEVGHLFNLPRFLGAATLLPHMSYPPQFREVGSIVHHFLSPVLAKSEYTSSVQAILYEVMGLTTGAPSNAENVAKAFGLYKNSKDETSRMAKTIIETMVMSGISDKLENVCRLVEMLLRNMVALIDSNDDEFVSIKQAHEEFKDLLPFILFFAGFPYAVLSNRFVPENLQNKLIKGSYEPSSHNVLSVINAKTSIPTSVLKGIDLSIWSISPFSKSDTGQLNRESVLGLILPLFNEYRVRFPDLPNDGLVKAIVSLAYCAVDHLEFLAEAIGVDTFVTQLIVHLVDLSNHPSRPDHVNQIVQRIRVNAGIVQKLSVMGVPGEKFLSLLMLSFPNMDDMAAIPGLIERVGMLRLGVEIQWAELFYALAVCSLSHLDGNADPAKHQQFTILLQSKLEPLLPTLGFKHNLIPTLAARLYLGDFLIFNEANDNEWMKLLLPSEQVQRLTKGVCGLLSYEPPTLRYRPAVVSGIVHLDITERYLKKKAHCRDCLPTGKYSKFALRMLLDGQEVAQETGLPPSEEGRTCRFTWKWDDMQSTVFDIHIEGVQQSAFDYGVGNDSAFIIVIKITGKLPEGQQLDIWWRAFPPVENAEALKKVRRAAARHGLRQLEKLSWWDRLHWGGVADSWWEGPLDLHPLIILLAAGDFKAVQLASDLLGVPDIVISFLFAHVISAPIEKLRPLLLADLCSEPVVLECVRHIGAMQGLEWIQTVKQDQGVKIKKMDQRMKKCGHRNAPSKDVGNALGRPSKYVLNDGNLGIQCTTIEAKSDKEEEDESQHDDDEDDINGQDDEEHEEGHSQDGDDEDPNKLGDDAVNMVEDEFDVPFEEEQSRPGTSHGYGAPLKKGSVLSMDLPTCYRDDNPFQRIPHLGWFPDELTEIFAPDIDDDQDGEEADNDENAVTFDVFDSLVRRVGDAPWKHWRQSEVKEEEQAPSKTNRSNGVSQKPAESSDGNKGNAQKPGESSDADKGHQSLNEFCIIELKKCMSDHQQCDTILDEWLTQYGFDTRDGTAAPLPYNVHLFLSLLLYQLFMLLDDENAQTQEKAADRMPTVSLVLSLSKMHQLRHEVCKPSKETKPPEQAAITKPPEPAVVMFHLLPAMWGLETHLRRAQTEVRKKLHKELQKADEKKKEHAWRDGGVAGFTVPPEVLESVTSGEVDMTDVDWQWDDWVWPEDEIVMMCCRIVQVARLSLGVAKPLECWHPTDTPPDLAFAIQNIRRHRREKSEMKVYDNRKERGWVSLSTRDSLQKTQHSQTLTLNPVEKKVAELCSDLLDHTRLRSSPLQKIFVCVIGGIDPFSETSSFKSLHFSASDYASIKRVADIYAAFQGLVSSRLRRREATNKMPSVSSIFESLLGPGIHDGACRVSSWAKKLGAELGIDCPTIEAMMNVGHGYIAGADDHDSPSAFKESTLQVLANRLRMTSRMSRHGKISGGLVLQQLCTRNWCMDSCRILGNYLGINYRIVFAIINASRGDVSGWIDLHTFLAFKRETGSKPNSAIAAASAAFNYEEVMDGSSRLQKNMIDALRMFDKEQNEAKRRGKVTTQKGWLSNLVTKILEKLSGDPDASNSLVLSTASLMLHLLSGQNVAAGEVLCDLANGKLLRKVAGLDMEAAASLLNLAYLTKNRGELRLPPNSESEVQFRGMVIPVHKIAKNLALPLVDSIFKLKEEQHDDPEAAVPKDAADRTAGSFDSDEPSDRVVVQNRLILCVDCMLGMAVKDNSRVLGTISKVMELGVHHIAAKQPPKIRKLLLQPNDDSKLQMFARLPMNDEILRLMREENSVLQFVLVQSLKMLGALKTFSSKRRLGTKSCNRQMRQMTEAMFTRPATTDLGSTLYSRPSTSELGATRPTNPGGDFAPTKRQQNQMLDTINSSTGLDIPDEPVEPSPEAVLERMSTRQQTGNAMKYFFLGIATHEMKGKLFSEHKENEVMGALMHVLPSLAAAATGRLDQLLQELKRLAKTGEHSDDLAFFIDLLCLLGLDDVLFKTHVKDDTNFLTALQDKLLSFVEGHCPDTYLPGNRDLRGKRELAGKLLKLMVAICVGVPPDELVQMQNRIADDVSKYLAGWLEQSQDQQFVKAGNELVKLVSQLITRAAEKRSLDAGKELDEEDFNIKSKILGESLDLLLPFIPHDMREPLLAVLKLMSVLRNVEDNPGAVAFDKYAPSLIEHMSTALCVPKSNVQGVIALSQGKWEGAVELCKPFCNLDSEVLRQISKLLPSVQKSIISAKDKLCSLEGMAESIQINSHIAGRVEQITTDALNNKGTPEELFELLDIDRNGFISQEEFQMLMKRLDFPLNSHRVVEIMSSCKKIRPESNQIVAATHDDLDRMHGLDQDEFKKALSYLRSVIAMNAMSNLKISWPTLMSLLCLFVLVLVLMFLFITLGINAFVSGGVFNSVINSVMTISTGLGGFQLVKAGGTDTDKKDGDTSHVKAKVQEVKSTFFGSG